MSCAERVATDVFDASNTGGVLLMRCVAPILLLSACAGVEAPAPCTLFCQSAADLYERCLDEWGLGWSEAGYEDEAAYLHSCQTWTWEQAQFEADALGQGEEVEGRLHQSCVDNTLLFSASNATCATYTDFDWSRPYVVTEGVAQ